MTQDEMVGWYPQLNGHEFEQIPEGSEGQGSLAHCSPWGHRESDTTECAYMYMQKAGEGTLTVSKPAVFHLAFSKFSLGVRCWERGCGGRRERLSPF